jgi:peptidoglycan/xylan/chitin deacetylase (PgdA/CDA1 family)
LNSDGESLRSACRFESEIDTAPPAGVVALTFDYGSDPVETPRILALLDRYEIGGTFFAVGEQMQHHPEVARLVVEGGRHILANHSWSHPSFHSIPSDAQLDEIRQTADLLSPITSAAWFRYPYGNATCESNAYLHDHGYQIVGWHVDTCDWAFDQTGTVDFRDAAICGVLPQNRSNFVAHIVASVRAHDGGIVLLHEIHHHTIAQLESVIEALRAAGFRFARLDDVRFKSSLR